MKFLIRVRPQIAVVFSVFLFGTFVAGCASESAEPNGTFEGEPFFPITSETGESWLSINGDADRIVFGRHQQGWSSHVLWETTKTPDGWSEPVELPFSGTHSDRAGRFYPALDALLFSSNRPVSETSEASDYNLWVVIHDGVDWLDPEPLTALNSEANDFHGSVTENGSIYFSSSREGGQGKSDIYRATLGIDGYVVESLGHGVNTEFSEADVFADPAEKYIIFSRTDDPAGLGGDDLWISFAQDDGWGAPQNLGIQVNSAQYEYGAYVSRDGSMLYFTSHRDGMADIMTIPMKSLGIEWPQ